MPTQQYVAVNPIVIDGVTLKPGSPIATLTTPEGVPLDRALNAINKSLAMPPDPAPAQPAK